MSADDDLREERRAAASHERVHLQQEILPRGAIAGVLFAALAIGAALCFTAYLLQWWRVGALRSARPGERLVPAPRDVSNRQEPLFRIANPRVSDAERDRRLLSGYGWLDRDRRIIHIPIERAMDLVAARARGQR
jgi:hypothetical protein